ncbi:hypothetical protein HRbin01_01733 [archaeon HR01]|nr:hypothetical protein HRbin01_01733 [archaeon HR01]
MIDEKICPRCGYRLSIPLKPSDSKVSKVWSLYCPRCGYSWSVKEPLEDVV